jgi:hypothetical protein
MHPQDMLPVKCCTHHCFTRNVGISSGQHPQQRSGRLQSQTAQDRRSAVPTFRITLSSMLGAACHLSGGAATVLLVYLALQHGLASLSAVGLQLALVLVVAVLTGNVIKECAFALCEIVVTALGRPFARRTVTVQGRLVLEVWIPGGVWIRCQTWEGGAACAWTESDGSCTRVESPAMTIERTAPPQTGTHAYVHGRDVLGGTYAQRHQRPI